MKQALRKGITLLLSLCMAMCFATAVTAEGEVEGSMNSSQFLGKAVGNVITLTGDVTITDDLKIEQDLTIDLNQKSLVLSYDTNQIAFGAAKVTLKNGTLQLSNGNDGYGPVRVGELGTNTIQSAALTLESVTVKGTHLYAPTGVFNLGKGCTLNIDSSYIDIDGVYCDPRDTGALIYGDIGGGPLNISANIKNTTISVKNGTRGIHNGRVSIQDCPSIYIEASDKVLNGTAGYMDLSVKNSTLEFKSTSNEPAIRVRGNSSLKFDNSKLIVDGNDGSAINMADLSTYTGQITFAGKNTVSLSGANWLTDGTEVVNNLEQLDTLKKYITIPDNSNFYEKAGVLSLCYHDGATHIEGAAEPTCNTDGYTGNTICDTCGKMIAEGTVKPKQHTLKKVDAVTPTCTEWGTAEYWQCEGVCNGKYEDENATKTLSVADIMLNPLGHDLKLVEAVKATTESEGSLAYYICNRCGRWFWDSKGENSVESQEAIVTAKLTSQTENVKSDVVEPAKEQTVTGQTESGAEVQLKVEIDTETLKENTVDTVVSVDKTSDDLKEKAVNLLKDAGEDVSTENVDVVLTPAVEIKNVQVNETDATITMNISLVCKAEARVNGKVVLEETTEVPNEKITKPTVITISVPASWNNETIIVRHETKTRGVQLYSAIAKDGVVTFEVPRKDGFSPFTLFVDDGATVTVKLDGETKTYNRMDVVNETALPALSKNNYLFKGWKFEGIENQHFNMTAELFEALLANHADTTVVNAVSVFEGPLSEHPEIEEAKKNGTWGVDENKPTATAKPAAAAAVTPVRSSIPKTSDDSNLMLWVCLMGLAALGLGGALYLKKRNNK